MALTPPPSAPDAPGDAPSRANPGTFRALADAFVQWQVGFRTWLASFVSWAATNVTELNALQSDVTTKATAATDAATAVAYIYPGTYATAPTLRPDGSAMQAGDIYTSTAGDNYRRVGSSWVVFPTVIYETNTFAPVVKGSSTDGVGTYSRQVGRYTRVGNTVHVRVTLAWSAHTGTGDMRITGLPYTSVNVTGHNHSLSVTASNITFTAGSNVTGYILPGTTEILLRQFQNNDGVQGVPMDSAVTVLVLTGQYEI